MEVTPNTFIKSIITPTVYNKIFTKKIKKNLATILSNLDKKNVEKNESLYGLAQKFYLSKTFKEKANAYYEIIVLTIFDAVLENCINGYYSDIDVNILDDVTYSFVGNIQEEGIDNSCIKEFLIKMIETLNDDKGLNNLLKEYKDKKCGKPPIIQGQSMNLPKVMTP